MKPIILMIMLFLLNTLQSVTRTVDIDGSGQYTTIQSAVNASTDNDIVLVYPGVYYENVDYGSRNITIGSLELTTGLAAYRDSTVIDGNHSGSCVRNSSPLTSAEIYGFTLQHGSGTPSELYGAIASWGGGIRILYASEFRIYNCLIINNVVTYGGGGIDVNNGYIKIKDTTITKNTAQGGGGGILLERNSNIIFDQVERCNVYENYAGVVNDICIADADNDIDVYLDMFTLSSPSDYYIHYNKSSPTWPGHFGVIDIQRGYRTEVNHDLYVSPTGDDSNSGFSFTSPLKSIANALHTIASDSLDIKSIYLAPGTYSSDDGQLFPLSLKTNVRLIGDPQNHPILENHDYLFTVIGVCTNNVTFSNLIFEFGEFEPAKVISISFSDNLAISNIRINPVTAPTVAGIEIMNSSFNIENIEMNGQISSNLAGMNLMICNGTVRNVKINDCHHTGGEGDLCIANLYCLADSSLVLESVSVTNCSVAYVDNSNVGMSFAEDYSYFRMSNILIADNTSFGQSPFLIAANSNNRSELTNCTIVDNQGAQIAAKFFGKMNVSNCIFDNNTNSELNIKNTQPYGFISDMVFSHNLIRGYPATVYVHPSNTVDMSDDNFTADPGFVTTDINDPFAFFLNDGSVCIDTGTPDTTGLFLPLTDLAGNYRIWNDRIDIGCYEYGSEPVGNDDHVQSTFSEHELSNYSNPFNPSTTISYSLKDNVQVSLDIYNIRGQLVKRLVHEKQTSGKHSIVWNGRDESYTSCTSGVYLYRLKAGEICKTNKMILMK